MPYWKNTSESTYTRPGDGEHPGWAAEPDDVVESDTNPAPGSFEETDEKPAEPQSEPEPVTEPAAPEGE